MKPFEKAQLKMRLQEEVGQSMILFAVLGSVMMMVMGLAVEGGNLFAQYRHMQSAADMAVLVGAQDLPCAAGGTGASCVSMAQTDACNYATDNGNYSCTASVPPVSCSPYDFIDYGNGTTNTSCDRAGGTYYPPTNYFYIEAQLSQPVFTVPIFNVAVRLTAHAVARKHAPTSGDLALIALSPNSSALTLQGNGTAEIGGSVFSNGSIFVNTNAGSFITCDGGWGTAANESTQTQLQSNVLGAQSFAPAQCNGGGTGTPDFQSQQQTIQDPYLGAQPPPSSLTTNIGEYYQWSGSNRSGGSWYSANTGASFNNGKNVELFPGVYPQGIVSHAGSNLYFNPGVYTLEGDFKSDGGTMCIFGAPACDENGVFPTTSSLTSGVNCSNANFSTGSSTYVDSGTWYYYCSYWGFWDANLASSAPTAISPSPPTFYDWRTGAAQSTPLNGVTFYIPNGVTAVVDLNGSGYAQYLAAPNPCLGTGQENGQSVPWVQGDANGHYLYAAGSPSSVPVMAGITNSNQVTNEIYPSADLSENGECNNYLETWPGEFINPPQHVEPLFWTQNSSVTMTYNGGGQQNMYGILYAPNSAMSISGNANATGGPPWLYGQVVSGTVSVNGNGSATVDYRPCTGGANPCVSGQGTSLIE